MFFDIVRELGESGMSCNQASPNLARCTWHGARFTIVRDDDEMRAQLLDDAGLGVHAWEVIDPILTRASAQRTGMDVMTSGWYEAVPFYDGSSNQQIWAPDVWGTDFSAVDFLWPAVSPILQVMAEDIIHLACYQQDRKQRLLGCSDCAPLGEFDEFGFDGFVGWTAPPHPIDYVPSLNAKDSFQQQARSVLLSFHYDDATKNWTDQQNVKDAFGYTKEGGYDVTRLIGAYENKNDPVWKKLDSASGSAPGQGWKDFDAAIRGAIQRRLKLGALPASSYDTDPIVVYYYDDDRMKKIVWPKHDVPTAIDPLNANATTYWRLYDVFTYETQDPGKIALERKKPGSPSGCYSKGRDGCRGAGGWDDEGFDWNKDAPGNVDAVFTGIASAVMEVIGAVLDVTGVGTAIGVALNVAGAVIPALIGGIAGVIDAGFQGTDNAGALLGIAKALLTAASAGFKAGTGVTIPPEALKALSGTVTMVAQTLDQAQKKRLNYTEAWNLVASKASKFTKLGDQEVHAISVLLGPTGAGKLFMNGYTVGRLAPMPQIAAIAKMVQAYGENFAHDPKAFNIFLLGAGLGHVASVQKGQKPKPLPSSMKRGTIAHHEKTFGHLRPSPSTGGVHSSEHVGAFATHADLSREEAYRMFGTDMGLCDVQPCLYTDMDGNPTMYASGRPAGHIGGDPSIDTTGKYLNSDGSSNYPNASGLLDVGWDGPSLPTDAHKNEVVRARREVALGGPERAHERVGAFFYDPDLAKFGNAFSPFVQTDSFERANLAMQRPFQDRYNPRYDNQPTWADWMGMPGYGTAYAVGVDMACRPPPTPEEEQKILRSGGQLGFQKSCEECGNCDSPDWIAYRSRFAARGTFEAVDKRALLTTGLIAGVTTLVALNNKEHWLEIAAVGVGGVALTWGMSAGAKQFSSR